MTLARPVAPPAVRWITRTLEDAGFETWTVGGAIRDALLGTPSGDWDLATRATPKEMRRIFRRTVPIGIEHGTVGVLARDGTMFEVTTFRKDVETDGRHAVVSFARTIEEDLARRDFTINAIAWHALRDAFCDPYGGAEDLEAGVLRTVGVSEERFREDYLRILRAFRFAGRFRLEVDMETWEAACALVDHLPVLSPERIREELIKILDQDERPSRALELYAESGALAVLYPELEALRGGTEWTEALDCLDRLPPGRPLLRLAALLRSVPTDGAAALLLRLRLSNAQTDRTARLAGAGALPPFDAPDAAIRRWLRRHGPESLAPIARIELASVRDEPARCARVVESWRRVRSVRRSRPPLEVKELEIDGRDLMRMGFKPGPHFGEILERLLDAVIEDPAFNRPHLLAEEARRIEAGLRSTRTSSGDDDRDGRAS